MSDRAATRSVGREGKLGALAPLALGVFLVLCAIALTAYALRQNRTLRLRAEELEATVARLRAERSGEPAASPSSAEVDAATTSALPSGAADKTDDATGSTAPSRAGASSAATAVDAAGGLREAMQDWLARRSPDTRDRVLHRLGEAETSAGTSSSAPAMLIQVALEAARSVADAEAALRWLDRAVQAGLTLDPELLVTSLTLSLRATDVTLLQKVVAQCARPEHAAPGIRLCEAAFLLRSGQAVDAQAVLDSIPTLDPKDYPAELDLALSVLPSDPRHAAARRLLGTLLAGHGRLAEAVRVWSEIVSGDPADAVAWDRLGVVLLESGNTVEAEKAFRSSAEQTAPAPAALFHLAVSQANQDRLEQAVETFHRAAEAGSCPAAARFGRAVCLARLGRRADARAELERCLAMDASLMPVAEQTPALAPILETDE